MMVSLHIVRESSTKLSADEGRGNKASRWIFGDDARYVYQTAARKVITKFGKNGATGGTTTMRVNVGNAT